MRRLAVPLCLAALAAGCLDGRPAAEAGPDCRVLGHRLHWEEAGLADRMAAWPAADPNVTVRGPDQPGLPVDPAHLPGGGNASLVRLSAAGAHGALTLRGLLEDRPDRPVLVLRRNEAEDRARAAASVAAFVDRVSDAPAADRTEAVEQLMAGWDEGRIASAFAPPPLDLGALVADAAWQPVQPGEWRAELAEPPGAQASVSVASWWLGHGLRGAGIDAAGAAMGPSDGVPGQVAAAANLTALHGLTRGAFLAWGLPEPDLGGAVAREHDEAC